MIISLLGLALGLAPAGTSAADLTIDTAYRLVRSQRLSRTEFAFTYQATVTNHGARDMRQVTARVTSLSPHTVVVDGELTFGDVPSGATVTSSDTFTIRQDRRFAFRAADLVWDIAGMPVPLVVPVPNVVGLSQAEAEAAILAAMLTVSATTTEHSATVPVGVVISQEPAAGTPVEAGSQVALTVSLGPAIVPTPDVVGFTHSAAALRITSANLRVGTITTAPSAMVPTGSVISQLPAATAPVVPGSQVDLVLALPPVGSTPPIAFTVDASVTPATRELPRFADGVPRTLTSIVDTHGHQSDFVENELVLVTDDASALTAFVARGDGTVLLTIDLAQAGLSGLRPMYLVRINADLANAAALVADLRAVVTVGQGNHRLASEGGLRLLAAAVMENAGGLAVDVNWVLQAHQFIDRTTGENSVMKDCSKPIPFVGPPVGNPSMSTTYTNNAFTWPYMGRVGRQNIGVTAAWRALERAGRLNNRHYREQFSASITASATFGHSE